MPMRNKGYLLSELLLVLFISLSMLSWASFNYRKIDFHDYLFISSYWHKQSEALAGAKKVYFKEQKIKKKYPIVFTKSGAATMGQSFRGFRHNFTIYLGNGYLKYDP